MNLVNWLSNAAWQSWTYVWSGRTFAIVLGIGFAVLAITLLVLSRTRWGQTKPITKCIVLSVLAHVWLIMYASGNRIVLPQGSPRGHEHAVNVSLDQFNDDLLLETNSTTVATESLALKPWEDLVPTSELPTPELPPLENVPEQSNSAPDPELPKLLVAEPANNPSLQSSLRSQPIPIPPLLEPKSSPAPPAAGPTSPDNANVSTPPSKVAPPPIAPSTGQPQEEPSGVQLPVLPPTISRELAAEPANAFLPSNPVQADKTKNDRPTAPFRPATSGPSESVLPIQSRLPNSQDQVPDEYRLRQAPNRLQLAMPYGADADSEAAVESGLAFLASAQSPDGSWNAKQFGAGTETRALGENRFGTGDRADTGVSGLALLAFLAGGHTHKEGKHQLVVRRGLEFLIRAQSPSGDLSGPKQYGHDPSVTNAKMYCHGIATLAIAEAYAMTHDPGLQQVLVDATKFTLNAQDKRSGGWRYKPGDAGDLSQFGWQAMAMRSAELSGIQLPTEYNLPESKRRMRYFIDSCNAGKFGGLARYRPQEGLATSTMTAEGLACRYLMNWPLSMPAQREAEMMIMSNLPGVGQDNVYYWYYATLALFQLQNDNWRQWNQALKAHLLKTQIPSNQPLAGSWTPDALWGGYGGRIYSSAMSCLCLEVYYRYLPMYQRANLAQSNPLPTSR